MSVVPADPFESVPIYTPANRVQWLTEMRLCLMRQGLYNVIEYNMGTTKAMARTTRGIKSRIDESMRKQLRDVESPKMIWQFIETGSLPKEQPKRDVLASFLKPMIRRVDMQKQGPKRISKRKLRQRQQNEARQALLQTKEIKFQRMTQTRARKVPPGSRRAWEEQILGS